MDVVEKAVKDSISLLIEKGYVVKKISKSMQKDSDECDATGGEKECLGCDCSICIMR